MRATRLLAALLGLLLWAGPTMAQDRPAPDARRDSLEARVRMRMAQMLRTQIGLDDEQMRRLQATNRRFEGQRRELFDQERRVRVQLRAAIELGDSTQNARIGPLLDRTMQLQRQRLDLQEAEQRELATFLTPLQRARLYGLEEQMRRRMQEMRDSGGPNRRGQGGARPTTPRRPRGER
jgi:hypothetical protein